MWNSVLSDWGNLPRMEGDIEYAVVDTATEMEFVNRCCASPADLETDAFTHCEIQYNLMINKAKMLDMIDEELNVITKTKINSEINVYSWLERIQCFLSYQHVVILYQELAYH